MKQKRNKRVLLVAESKRLDFLLNMVLKPTSIYCIWSDSFFSSCFCCDKTSKRIQKHKYPKCGFRQRDLESF